MPSHPSVTVPDQANVTTSKTPQPLSAAARNRAAAKGVATSQRHRQERRAESLAEIQAQIVDGTLVVRQMTTAERRAASGAGRRPRTLCS